MTTNKHGGNAFPCANDCRDNEMGMTLRDYFAATALNGLLSYSYCNPANGNFIENSTPEMNAQTAYEYADEMLKARQQ
jgi:hypothetical protein